MYAKEGAGRLIPAHAGSTSFSLPFPDILSAHPRSRGEHLIGSVLVLLLTGSSPLTRGAQLVSHDVVS